MDISTYHCTGYWATVALQRLCATGLPNLYKVIWLWMMVIVHKQWNVQRCGDAAVLIQTTELKKKAPDYVDFVDQWWQNRPKLEIQPTFNSISSSCTLCQCWSAFFYWNRWRKEGADFPSLQAFRWQIRPLSGNSCSSNGWKGLRCQQGQSQTAWPLHLWIQQTRT